MTGRDDGSRVSARAPRPVGAYPHARRAGDFLFLSGIGPRVPGTDAIPGNETDAAGRLVRHDIVLQTRQVFANIRAILEDAGARWEDIVDVTVFLTDMAGDFPAFNRIYAEHFATHQPTRTTVEVGALPTPIAVELKVVAWVGAPPGGAGA
jgi:2-aminomuconate deaminase